MNKLLSDLFSTGDGGPKNPQKILLLALGALGIFLLLLGNMNIGGGHVGAPMDAVTAPEQDKLTPKARLQIQSEEKYLAQKVQAMLQQISGAGSVEVSVQLEGSTISEYAVNQTTGRKVADENDSGGINRVTTDVTESGQLVVVRGDQGDEVPVVERELAPRVAGVLVVADGARNPEIKAELFRATRVALGVEPHKILVLPKRL